MSRPFTQVVPPHAVVWLAVTLVLGCEEQPVVPTGVMKPTFAAVTSDGTARVLKVGVDVPAKVEISGTVAGVVVLVDNATVDLSHATVDCSRQTTADDPRAGVWIVPGRSHVHVKGGGTGVIENCGVGVLIGPTVPMDGVPGAFGNKVDGLVLHDIGCPSGPYWPLERACDIAIAVANSHDNTITDNRSDAAEWGIVLMGADPDRAISGENEIYRNTMVGNSTFAMFVASNGNTVRDNVIDLGDDPATFTIGGIRVDGDANVFSGNTLAALGDVVQVSGGATDNTVTKNIVKAGHNGFVAETNTFRNVFNGNTALSLDGLSAIDRSGACTNNTWRKNTFASALPLCILGVTLEEVTVTSSTALQLEGEPGMFSATITNQGSLMTDVALRSWVAQGRYTRRAGGFSLVDCRAAPGVLGLETCTAPGNSLIASNVAGGRGTLAVGGASAVVELVRVVDGDTGVMDSRAVPITVTRPVTGSYWEIKPPMPTPRYYPGLAVVGDTLYAIGGEFAQTTVEAYHGTTNSWTTGAALPWRQDGAAVAAVNGVVYVAGGLDGYSYTGILRAYDPTANAWSAWQPMPTPRSGAGAGVIDGVLYVVGGNTGSGFTGAVEAYDPVNNGWTTEASMPTPRSAGVGVVNGVLYAVGGFTGSAYTQAVEAYDPVSNSWSTRASLPAPSYKVAVSVVDGVLYAMRGDESGSFLAYDPVADTWISKGTIPTPRWGLEAATVSGVLYTVGGVPFRSNDILGTMEAYHP
jgi:hypothetical protein